jgi:spermine oxidase
MSSHHEVIVIGGGMSGLSACVKLIESGVKDVLLIEGNDRLGGRINTIQYRNLVLNVYFDIKIVFK